MISSSMIPFTKMHGLGNDFIIIEKAELQSIHIQNTLEINDFIVRFSNRYTGVGCDQFILYEITRDGAMMEIYNPDGSKAAVCGNATRCIAYLLHERNGYINSNIYSDKRKLQTFFQNSNHISVNMGSVDFAPLWAPAPNILREYLASYISNNTEFLCISIGNPHIVLFSQEWSDQDMNLLGPKIEKSDIFPGGVNVNFAKLLNGEIVLRVWERGNGFTYACGSGACATFAAARKLGFVEDNAKVRFELGYLDITTSEEDIIMTGPVKLTARGVLYNDPK